MSRPLPTASQLHRAFLCVASAVFVAIREITPYGERGTLIHTFLENVNRFNRDRERALLEIPADADDEVRAVCEAIDLDRLPLDPALSVAELAIAWSATTGIAHELGRGIKRNYKDATDDEMIGTTDSFSFIDADGIVSRDFKSGMAHLPHPAAHAQTRFNVMAGVRAFKRHYGIGEIIRIDEMGRAWTERHTFDDFAIAEIAEEHRELAADVMRHRDAYYRDHVEPPMTVGEHCTGCPAARKCPARLAVISAAAGEPRAFLERVQDELDSGHGAKAVGLVRVLESLLEELKTSIKLVAERQPIDMGGGRFYGPTTQNIDVFEGNQTWQVLSEKYGAELAWLAVEIGVTKKSKKQGAPTIDALVRVVARRDGKKLKHVTDDIMGELRLRGASRKIQRQVFRTQAVKGTKALDAGEQKLLTDGSEHWSEQEHSDHEAEHAG